MRCASDSGNGKWTRPRSVKFGGLTRFDNSVQQPNTVTNLELSVTGTTVVVVFLVAMGACIITTRTVVHITKGGI